MENQNNRITVIGHVKDDIVFSHQVKEERFYQGIVLSARASGTFDRLPFTVSEKLLNDSVRKDAILRMDGQIRAYNRHSDDGKTHLAITIFAQDICAADMDTTNDVALTGVLCKPPVYRYTPLGREICDMMLAVDRAFGKSDYIPCIAWGRNAQYASRFHIGDHVTLTGRLQSRECQKLQENGEYMTRIAYEVSAFTLDKVSATE